MRHLTLLFFVLVSCNLKSQELKLNPSNNFYEYSHVKEHNTTKPIEKFNKRLEKLNYNDIFVEENIVKGKGFTNHLVGGFATVEIHFLAKIELKEKRYRLTLTNFTLTDVNGTNPLEGMGAFKKSWVRKINKKLPLIIKNLEAIEMNDEW